MFHVSINLLLCYFVVIVKYTSIATKIQKDSEIFVKIRHSSIFVDKTLLLKRILKHDFLHITAPAKFGKTTNLQMIKLFFGCHRHRKILASYFKHTKIWNFGNFVVKHMGNYPVIHCSFKPTEIVKNHRDVVNTLKTSIKRSFLEHKYVLNSSLVDNSSKIIFERYSQLKEKEYEIGINFLSRILHVYYKKKVIVLIDDFDTFLTKSIFYEDLNPAIVSKLLFRILDNTINLNDFVERAVVMSAVAYKLGTQFSGTYRLETFKFMETEEFAQFFGFTVIEVEELLDRLNLTSALVNVALWYGGYSCLLSDFQVYNPQSVLYYIKNKIFEIYWVSKPQRKTLCRYIKPHYLLREVVIPKLLKRESIAIRRINTFTSYEVENLKEFNMKSAVADELSGYNQLLQFFLERGYLTITQNCTKGSVPTSVTLPNMELHRVFELILEHLTATYYDSYTE